ncbi:MAG TPA: aldose 1-epimerase family protein [Solirubrobacteraceae bacterium]|nr:aldose 1-epimerase family protein [Solirubrobacteraceae bacterium]
MTVVPSGEQYEIAYRDQRAVIVEVGGGLRTYTAGGADVLDGYPPEAMSSGGRGQLLIPWPNRVNGGRWSLDGEGQQLPLTEVAAGNAIHGLVRWASWAPAEHDGAAVTMAHRLHPQPGWPGTLDLAARYALDDDGLTVTVTARNAGGEPCPYGVGAHPYLTVGTPRVDAASLELPAATRLVTDERGIPTAAVPVQGTRYDFRAARPIGDDVLDTGFTDLTRDADGRVRVRLSAPDGRRGVSLWADRAFTHLMVFTGDTLAPAARRRGVAIEPMSCPPNALATGEGLAWLNPGERHVAQWGLHPALG